MKMRTKISMTVAPALSLGLVGTSCGAPPEPVPVIEQDPSQWSAEVLPPAPEGGFAVSGTVAEEPDSSVVDEVEPGWYEIVVSCAGTQDVTLDLRGPTSRYGTGYVPCGDSPITIRSFLGDNPHVPAEDVSVIVSQASSTALWGVTASPTEAPG